MKLIKWLTTNQKYVTRGAAIALLVICYFQQKEVSGLRKALSVKTIERDSLYQENFPCQIEKGRYEVALSMLKEDNPRAAEQFEFLLSKTE